MQRLLLLFPAVKAQVIRWSTNVYCNYCVLMTVFLHGQWLNMFFISLWLSLTPTAQQNLLIKHQPFLSPCFFQFCFLLTLLLCYLLFAFSSFFLLSCFHLLCPLFALCLTVFIPHLSQFFSLHLMEAKGRQNDAIIKHGLYNGHDTVGCFAVPQPPTGLMSLSLSWLAVPESLTYLCRLIPVTNQTKPTPNTLSVLYIYFNYESWESIFYLSNYAFTFVKSRVFIDII